MLECIICAASGGLPKPNDLKMDAVNTRYLLSWHWGADSVTMVTNTSVNFRAQRTYSDQAQNEDSYTDICVGVETHCDYSSHLKYSGQYALRVRAENRGQRSDWALQEFCPDEQAVLGAPSELRVEAGVSMVTVSFKEPTGNRGELMSSLLSPMAFRIRFSTSSPEQHQEKEIGTTLTTLRSLHAHTRYCMEVQAFSKDFDKTSPYTPRLCTTTLGPTLVWPTLLLLLSAVVVLSGVSYLVWSRIQRGMVLRSVFPIPSSLLIHSISHQPLLVTQETTCTVTAVVAMPTGVTVLKHAHPTAPGPKTGGYQGRAMMGSTL